ncbi:MAG: YfiM family protein [Flavobacteriaceae bacterium]|nr:YfiM family protein [Flavobacteriaceae bacterium]
MILKAFKKHFILFLFFGLSSLLCAQTKISFFQKSDTLNKNKRKAIILTESIGAGLTFIGLNQLWYADYPKSKFRFYNDNDQWLQMDKVGHTFSSYYIGKMGMDALNWAGDSKKNQRIYGATLGFAFLAVIEVFDGFSKEWGFSMGDFAANAAGTSLLIGQELLWNEQRIIMKYSFHTTGYPDKWKGKLGDNISQQVLKDYNGQTYWLSVNVWSFFKDSNFPKWLNLAFGYGIEGFDGTENNKYRQFYSSIDIDLTKIKTKSAFLSTVFNIVNSLKIPAPTLEYSENKFKFHLLYF